MRRHLLLCATLLLCLACSPAFAASVQVTSCGAVYTGSGILMNDLDCSGMPMQDGIRIIKGRLDMNGHSLIVGNVGIRCNEKCSIYGPGTITGTGNAINGDGKSLKVRGVTIDVSHGGIYSNNSDATRRWWCRSPPSPPGSSACWRT